MADTRIILSGLWVAVMLIYLLGDVLRIFSGDFTKMGGMQDMTQGFWLGIAILMLTPILMLVLNLMLPYPAIRWVNIIAAIFWFVFNIIGLSGYPGAYDKFLLIVSLGFNVLTVWYAWKWV
jgi:hypothetical protein